MIRLFVGAMVLTVLACSMFGQLPPGMLKGYKTHDDYCRENPKMPTCIKLQLPEDPLGTGIIYKPGGVSNGTPSPRVGGQSQPRPYRPLTVQPRPSGPVSAIALQDWRFSHTSPAMLINVNIRSLLQSPLWKILFSGWIGGSPQSREADLDKARSALGDIGQILISVSPNHTSTPSFLMLARGNVDSTVGAMLRSSAGMQAKRIDEFSLLVGDPGSMELADVRMKSKFPRSTFNALQQIATAESQKYDIWVGADPRNLGRMASLFGGANQAALAVLRGFSLGIYLRDQIRVEVAIEAPSPEIAQRILAAYHQEEAKKKKGDKDLFGGQTWLTVEGAKLQFIGIADAAQLKADPEFEAAMAKIGGPQIGPVIQALAGMASVQRSAAESPRTKPGAIMIQGLEGGPKEIPTK